MTSPIVLGSFREVIRECTGIDVLQRTRRSGYRIWDATWVKDAVIMDRAVEILPFINGEVCLRTVTEISTEDKNSFGEKLENFYLVVPEKFWKGV